METCPTRPDFEDVSSILESNGISRGLEPSVCGMLVMLKHNLHAEALGGRLHEAGYEVGILDPG